MVADRKSREEKVLGKGKARKQQKQRESTGLTSAHETKQTHSTQFTSHMYPVCSPNGIFHYQNTVLLGELITKREVTALK
jgi:hypothetical protein